MSYVQIRPLQHYLLTCSFKNLPLFFQLVKLLWLQARNERLLLSEIKDSKILKNYIQKKSSKSVETEKLNMNSNSVQSKTWLEMCESVCMDVQ